MTKQSDGKYLWTAPTGKTPDKIIFSDNGNNQTADLAFENGATYDCSGTIVEAGNGEIPDDPTVNPGNDDFAVYFDNSSSNWDTVMVHYWGGDSQSTWPGATMSPYYEKVYKYVVPDNTTGLVFNNGNGTQTGDFTAIKGHLYTMNGDQGVYDDPYASVESIIDDQIQTPVYYNLQGIRVSKPTHGIYILNGKKILIK
jgi:hypothetical protein